MKKTDSEMAMKFIAERIKEMRKKKKITQEEMAKHLDITRTSLSNMERGFQNITIHNLIRIADVLDCDVRELIPRTR